MAKVCFVNPDSINVTPYFRQYEKCLDGKPYDLIYWDRGLSDEAVGAQKIFRYSNYLSNRNILLKYLQLGAGYAGFRRFAKKVLATNNYDSVVFLTGNSAAILFDVIASKYSGRVIVDIRDYFLEGFFPYYKMEETAISHSALTIISSPGYRNFLPAGSYCCMHNVQEISSEDFAAVQNRVRPCSPLVLSSIGTAKNLEMDRRVIRYFANDDRFKLRFIGRGYEKLRSYIEAEHIANVEIVGEFKSSETLEFYKNTDAVLCMYGHEKMHHRYQLTNKLYYAAQLQLPLVASPKTSTAEIVSAYNLGCILDLDSPLQKTEILEQFNNEKIIARNEGAVSFMRAVEEDNRKAFREIKKCFFRLLPFD